MSHIKGRDTGIERRVRSELQRRGLRFRKHVKELPGKPDVVFTKARVAIFINGGFWHGYHFFEWENKISDFWKIKITKNRKRDEENYNKLREMGWTVVQIWQHELKHDFEGCMDRIIASIQGVDNNLPCETLPEEKLFFAEKISPYETDNKSC